jgi:outer membrane receptor for ferrienterochelin and colicins
MKSFLSALLIIFSLVFSFAQNKSKKLVITGKIIDIDTKLPIEYATITAFKTETKTIVGGNTTDAQGNFSFETPAGTFDVKFEFFGFTPLTKKGISVSEDLVLGEIGLAIENKQIEGVVIRAEVTSTEIKLDKKVYTVGKDILVKGGTVADVLDNIPSVAVDVEGNVSLRGNENVRILIDGRPSNAISVADALKQLPAESIDKVEVITNPSARYDAEGGAGIVNILLKKGKKGGLNGTIIVNTGYPKNNGISLNLNTKTDNFNLFSTIGYNDRITPGRTKINQENFDRNRNLVNYVEERRNNERFSKGFNINFGVELFLTKKLSWTNAFNYRRNNGGNDEDVKYFNYDNNRQFLDTRLRDNTVDSKGEAIEFTSNYNQQFKKDGHKLNIDFSASKSKDNDDASILGSFLETNTFVSDELSFKKDRQTRTLLTVDYVLPLFKNTQFEAGYRGSYTTNNNFFNVQERLTQNANYTNIPGFTNEFEYVESISGLYTQLGSKFGKLSVLGGLRFEYTNLDVNQLINNNLNNRVYRNLFPSLFFNYELQENFNLTLNYSKRINRPRDRFINPFTSYTSNVNLFEGNPYLNPAFTDVFDFGFIKKFSNLTLTSSVYYNHTTDVFQFVRRERGDVINGIPVIVSTAFNLATEDKVGLEVNANFSVKKWWRITSNFNYFNVKSTGKYEYVNIANNLIVRDFGFNANTWTVRINSKINLPYKIDFQSNVTYNADQKNAQGISKAITSINLGFSKDVLKDKATIAFNVSDLLNSRKRIQEVQLQNVNSYAENQFRVRQFTLSFTYRFNKQKNERDTKPKREEQDGGGEF